MKVVTVVTFPTWDSENLFISSFINCQATIINFISYTHGCIQCNSIYHTQLLLCYIFVCEQAISSNTLASSPNHLLCFKMVICHQNTSKTGKVHLLSTLLEQYSPKSNVACTDLSSRRTEMPVCMAKTSFVKLVLNLGYFACFSVTMC